MQEDTLQNWLKHNDILSHIDTKSLQIFINQARLQTFKKDEPIFIQNDVSHHFYIITKGWVKIFRETLDGSQAIIDMLSSPHIFGEKSIFTDRRYDYNASATNAVELIAIPLDLLKNEIDTNPDFAHAFMKMMATHHKKQENDLEHITLQKAPERIGCFILRLIDQHQTEKTSSINLPYDKTLVAARLGMKPETFSRALNKLRQDVGIEISGATITIDNISELSRYACGACSAEFPCKS